MAGKQKGSAVKGRAETPYLSGVTAPINGGEVTVERFDDHMSIEDQAEMEEAHNDLSGSIDVMWGHLRKASCRARASAKVRRVVPASVRNELMRIRDEAVLALDAFDRIWK